MTDRSYQSPESNRDVLLPTFTGTEVGYYFVCKKKLWWFAHGVEMEHENDRVRMGRLVHQESYARRKKELNVDDRIVLDWREDGIIHEVKLTDSMERAHEMQLLYYLYYLKHRKGVEGLRGQTTRSCARQRLSS
jgi:CRISPR-associated exonuclease Cas4